MESTIRIQYTKIFYEESIRKYPISKSIEYEKKIERIDKRSVYNVNFESTILYLFFFKVNSKGIKPLQNG